MIAFKFLKLDLHINTIEFIVSSANTISSILIGFTGVLVGILFSYNSKIMTGIKRYRSQDLQKFILEPIKLGLLVIILGCLLYYLKSSNYLTNFITILFILLISLVVGLLLSTWRIINILTLLIINSPNSSPD